MDRKRGWIGFAILIAFVIFSISLVYSASCTLSGTNCADANRVMKLSASTNAHGELYSGSAYTQYLCCDFAPAEGHTCSSSNVVLRLSATTNAHAEIPSLSTYSTSVCFGALTCTSQASSTCPANYPMPMVSLSANTNAHIAAFGTAGYGTNICCNANLALCGNGVRETGEACDDGDTNGGDGCSATCTIESGYTCTNGVPNVCIPVCGNGVRTAPETCDDGNSSLHSRR